MKSILAIALALVCVGCANLPDQSAEPRANKEYVTGSSLPQRHGTAGPTAEADRDEVIREMTIRAPAGPAK